MKKIITKTKFVDGIMHPAASNSRSQLGFPKAKLAAKLTVILLIVGLNWVGLSAIGTTVAFFDDIETSSNVLIAGQLDFILDQSAWSPILGELDLQPGDTISQDVTIIDVDDKSIDFKYIVRPIITGGDVDFCNALELSVYLEGSGLVYTGLLFDFVSATTTFATTTDTWTFDVSLPSDAPDFADNSCEFDFVYSGWQIIFPNEGEGFYDVEFVSNTIGQLPVEVGQCDALSIGYWKNHEGCSGGDGISIWKEDINTLSTSLYGVFAGYSGGEICDALWIPNCPSGNTLPAKLCKAKAVTLADELNIVADRLQTIALIAGADDGDPAFDNLGLSATSTVEEALLAVEFILNENNDTGDLRDAGHVAERIYAFYEEENPIAPYCIFSESELIVMNEMLPNPNGDDWQDGILGEWVELYNIGTIDIDVANWTISELVDPDGAATEKFYTIVASSPSVGEVRTLSGSTVIAGGGFLVILFEAARLNNTGDTVTLYDSGLNLIDQHKYIDGEAPEGKSIARIPSGFGDWVDPIPTPGSDNTVEEGTIVDTLDAFIDLALGFIIVDDGSGDTGADTSSFALATADTEAPVITIQPNNPAYISLGATYSDLGAMVTDNVNDNLGISVSVDGVEVVGGYGEIILDTSTSTTYAITYSATDQAGNTGEDTRLVVVYDPILGIPEEAVIEGPVATSGGSSGVASSGDDEPVIDSILGCMNDIADNYDLDATEDDGSCTEPPEPASDLDPDTIAPIITLNGTSTVELIVGDAYTEEGAVATDDIDDDITADIIIGGDVVGTTTPAGTYAITYNVSDTAGNVAEEVTRIVNVVEVVELVIDDIIPPTITLIGGEQLELYVGDTFTELGFEAVDDIDGDITASVIVGGDIVDTVVAGVYVISYNVSDTAGNAAGEVTRTVTVIEPVPILGCMDSTADNYDSNATEDDNDNTCTYPAPDVVEKKIEEDMGTIE